MVAPFQQAQQSRSLTVSPETGSLWPGVGGRSRFAIDTEEQKGNNAPSESREKGYGPRQAECVAAQIGRGVPLSGGAPAAAALRRQRHHEFPDELRRQVRHVCRGRIRGVRTLLLRRPARCGNLPLTVRAEVRATQARRMRGG